jgi:hypothetical protein
MATIDPVASATETIAAYLTTTLGPDGSNVLSKVIRGWPESAESLDLSGLPVVSVTPGGQSVERCSPKVVDEATDEDTGVTTYTYRVGWLTFTAQIDLWAAYKAQIDDVAPSIEDACIQDPPLPPELRLDQSDYHDRPLTCTLGAGTADNDGDSANKGEWRMTWDLVVETDVVRTRTHVPAAQVDITVDDEVADPETITVLP